MIPPEKEADIKTVITSHVVRASFEKRLTQGGADFVSLALGYCPSAFQAWAVAENVSWAASPILT